MLAFLTPLPVETKIKGFWYCVLIAGRRVDDDAAVSRVVLVEVRVLPRPLLASALRGHH